MPIWTPINYPCRSDKPVGACAERLSVSVLHARSAQTDVAFIEDQTTTGQVAGHSSGRSNPTGGTRLPTGSGAQRRGGPHGEENAPPPKISTLLPCASLRLSPAPNSVQILHPAGLSTGFGRVVGDARRAKHLTQEDAAKLLGMSRRKLLDIEADRFPDLPRYERAGILSVLESAEDGHFYPTSGIHHGADGVPVARCLVLLNLKSGDTLCTWWKDQVGKLKGAKADWPDHLKSIRTIAWQFEELRERLKRTKPKRSAIED